MIFRRSLEGAEKCALRHLRREELTLGEYFILPVWETARGERQNAGRAQNTVELHKKESVYLRKQRGCEVLSHANAYLLLLRSRHETS